MPPDQHLGSSQEAKTGFQPQFLWLDCQGPAVTHNATARTSATHRAELTVPRPLICAVAVTPQMLLWDLHSACLRNCTWGCLCRPSAGDASRAQIVDLASPRWAAAASLCDHHHARTPFHTGDLAL